MKIINTKFKGLKLIKQDKFKDKRGYLRITYNKKLMKEGFVFDYHTNSKKNSLRGFHFQYKHQQSKYISVIKGKILETSGYEVLLLAEEIVSVEDSNKASDADSIKGKRVRISGFFNDHADKFNSLQTSDTLRVGIQHRNRVFDMFDVTDVLEIVEP